MNLCGLLLKSCLFCLSCLMNSINDGIINTWSQENWRFSNSFWSINSFRMVDMAITIEFNFELFRHFTKTWNLVCCFERFSISWVHWMSFKRWVMKIVKTNLVQQSIVYQKYSLWFPRWYTNPFPYSISQKIVKKLIADYILRPSFILNFQHNKESSKIVLKLFLKNPPPIFILQVLTSRLIPKFSKKSNENLVFELCKVFEFSKMHFWPWKRPKPELLSS